MPDDIRALPDTADRTDERALYEADEHAWIADQIAALTAGELDRLDRFHLIEYLTDMTVRDQRELQSRLVVLLHHLLKVRLQPERLSRGWVNTIIEQQSEIRLIIEGIPSLGRQAQTIASAAYPEAIRRAARETGLATGCFPSESPWTVEQALAFDPPEPVRRPRGVR